jgi:hypothetical protein
MDVRKRTEITIETDEVLVVRRARVYRAWCGECAQEVDMVNMDDAHALVGSRKGIAEGHDRDWHIGASGEMALVCMPSLLKSM